MRHAPAAGQDEHGTGVTADLEEPHGTMDHGGWQQNNSNSH